MMILQYLLLFCRLFIGFQLFNHMLDNLFSFLRLVVNIRVHVCQEFLKDLQDKWFCDREAHMITGICLVSKRAGVATETHAKVLRQMVQRFL